MKRELNKSNDQQYLNEVKEINAYFEKLLNDTLHISPDTRRLVDIAYYSFSKDIFNEIKDN